jgi:hypothetical protein
MRDTLVLCFIANPLAFCQLYHPLGLCQLYPFTMRVLWDLDTFNHVPSGACFLSILVVSFHMNLECTSFYPFGPQRKSESLIFTDFRFAHLMIYAFRSPINCSKRVSGEQKPLTNTCSPTRQLIIYPCAMRVFWVVETSIHAPSGACFLGILVLSFHMDFECSQMLTYPVTRVLCHRKSSPNKKD